MAVRAYNAAIDGIGCVQELVLGEKADDLSIVCSSSDNAFFEVDGNTDWHGYYVALSAEPAYYPNDTFTLTFNINQDVDKGGTGDVIVESVRIDWDFVTGAPIRHIVKFGGNGTYTPGAQTTSDDSTPSPKPTRDGKISIAVAAGSPSFSDLGGILTASLVIYADIIPYADSSTGGIYKRAAGPMGWDFMLSVHVDDPTYPATIVGLNGNSHIRAYVDSTEYYDIKWVKWKELGPLKIPIQGREYVSSRYIGKGAAFVPISGTWTKGAVTSPGGTAGDIWGA